MEELRLYSKYLALVIAIIISLKHKDVKGTKAKYFIYSIWFIVATEFIGTYFYRWFGVLNYPVYAFYTFAQLTFYLWWYRSLLRLEKRKKIVSVFIIIYGMFCLVNAIFIQDIFTETASYSYALGVIFVVTTICYYFIEIFNSEKVLRVRQSVYFWISIGIVLFHATYLPFYFASKFFLFSDIRLFSAVNFFLCLIMYSCFAIGFFKAKQSANEHPLN